MELFSNRHTIGYVFTYIDTYDIAYDMASTTNRPCEPMESTMESTMYCTVVCLSLRFFFVSMLALQANISTQPYLLSIGRYWV